jgi:hypothetical protein
MHAKEDALTALLNELSAICIALGRGGYRELAAHLGKTPQQVVSWVTLRDTEPQGRTLLAMQEFVAQKREEITRLDLDRVYKREFRIACIRHPLNGAD